MNRSCWARVGVVVVVIAREKMWADSFKILFGGLRGRRILQKRWNRCQLLSGDDIRDFCSGKRTKPSFFFFFFFFLFIRDMLTKKKKKKKKRVY